jgi:hypothetical protein
MEGSVLGIGWMSAFAVWFVGKETRRRRRTIAEI